MMNKVSFGPESRSEFEAHSSAHSPAVESMTPAGESATSPKWYVPRLRAAGVHFLLSFAVVFCALMLVVIAWYPGALLHASGGVKLLVLMVVVDLILGPVLTFSVFNRKKKSLPFDLAVIAALQLGALTFGLHAAYNGRPVFQVFVVDRIELISAAEVDPDEIKLADPKFRDIAFAGSTLVAAKVPTDSRARVELAMSAAAGIDVKHFLRYYVDFASERQAILAASKPLAELEQFNDPVRVHGALAELVRQTSKAEHTLRYLPVQGKREDLAMIIDSGDASVVGLLRLRPWND